MEQTELLSEAITLTLFGMGFVFMFLTLLVFVTKTMSTIVGYLYKNYSSSFQQNTNKDSLLNDEIDDETKFIIEQAIKMHRGS
jgi:oxaloacetate decarboxylase gamma subunit